MIQKKISNFSVITLIVSLTPLLTFVTFLPQVTLTSELQTVWAGINIICVISSLVLSIMQVKKTEKRNSLSIISLIASLLLMFTIVGCIALADVYYAFKRPAWAERKRRKVRADKERSLEVFMDDGFDIPSEQALVDEIVADKLLLDELYAALAELTDDERNLIDALYFNEKSERELSKESGIPQKTINNRKQAILKKLKKFY